MSDKNNESKSPTFYTRLIGGVDYASVKDVIKDVDMANSLNYVKEIYFTICSMGGLLYPAYALYDHIKTSKKPVDIIAKGTCMSAAVLILQAARRRLSTQNTVFMVHPSSYDVEQRRPLDEFLTITEEYKRIHELCIKLTIERSGMNRNEFEKIYKPRKYLSPEEARKIGTHGLIDEIINS